MLRIVPADPEHPFDIHGVELEKLTHAADEDDPGLPPAVGLLQAFLVEPGREVVSPDFLKAVVHLPSVAVRAASRTSCCRIPRGLGPAYAILDGRGLLLQLVDLNYALNRINSELISREGLGFEDIELLGV